MALPVPNLDDRRFDELLREARQRIARLCPAWTDFNPSDPGMTLVELMAWLTDLTLYRVNRIPERSYAVFLNLMGVRLRPPEAARTWLLFEPRPAPAGAAAAEAEGGGPAPVLVEPGTAAQAQREGGSPLVFSTTEALNLTPVRPVAVFFAEGEAALPDFHGEAEGSLLRAMPRGRPPMALVAGGRVAEHLLFLGDPAGAAVPEAPPGGRLHLEIGLKAATDRGAEVEWERAAGGSPEGERDPLHGGWRPWTPEADGTLGLRQSGRITFRVTEPLFPRPVEGGGILRLRGRLLRAQPEGLPELTGLAHWFELPPEAGQPPERLCGRSAQGVIAELPIPRPAPPGAGSALEVQPFGAEPAPETALLIGSPLLDRPGAEISVRFALRSEGPPAEGAPPELRWEMYGQDGRWIPLGRSTPEGAVQEEGAEAAERRFADGTNALTRSGTVTFRRPEGTAPYPALGEAGPFLRVRLAAGRPHRVFISDIRIAFADPPRPFGLVLAERYGRPERLDERLAALGKDEAVRPFEVHRAEDAGPSLLIGLSGRPADALQRLFLDLRPPREAAAPDAGLRRFFAVGPGGDAAMGPRTAWACSAGEGWTPLLPMEDGTRDLAMRGTIAFLPPAGWAPQRIGGVEAHWLRARLDPLLRPEERPRLAAVATNTAEAMQAEVVRDTILTAALTGEPWQRVALPFGPVLPGPVLAIRELDEPSEDALAALRAEPGVVLEDTSAEERQGAARAAWVRWQEVPDFFDSGPESRHYTFDPVEGSIGFGDGRHGRIPPPGADRVRLVRLLRGGGAGGNLAARSIDQLLRPVEGVDRVFNPVPAEGGADAEPVAEALQRGPYALRHRERAVTAEDYVRLARAASRGVARASCSVAEDGLVQVLVIPKEESETPYPGRYLVERVQSYLEERRVIGTRLRVTGPDYVEVAVRMGVGLRPTHVARMAEVRRRIEAALRGFVHPVHGGPDLFVRARAGAAGRGGGRQETGGEEDAGWPLGRSLHVSELYYVVEQIEGVEYAEGIRLAKLGEDWREDRIGLGPTALPHFLRIEIEQRR